MVLLMKHAQGDIDSRGLTVVVEVYSSTSECVFYLFFSFFTSDPLLPLEINLQPLLLVTMRRRPG